MKIVAVDDDAGTLSVLTWMLKKDGHDVQACSTPEDAIHCLRPDVDLVISDVGMPGMTGFEIAQLVSARVGHSPPRTLLLSGDDHSERLDDIPPAQIIGLMCKPIALDHMLHVVRLIAYTRQNCPGNLAAAGCPLKAADTKCASPELKAWARYCTSTTYADCPLFNGNGGQALRDWIKGLNPPPVPQ